MIVIVLKAKSLQIMPSRLAYLPAKKHCNRELLEQKDKAFATKKELEFLEMKILWSKLNLIDRSLSAFFSLDMCLHAVQRGDTRISRELIASIFITSDRSSYMVYFIADTLHFSWTSVVFGRREQPCPHGQRLTVDSKLKHTNF